MPQQHLRVLMNFGKQTDNELVETIDAAIQGLTGNKAYPALPVDLATLEAARNDFSAAIAAQTQGGPTATVAKDKKRQEVVRMLRKLASYVQAVCDDDMTTLLSSGFQALGARRPTGPLPSGSLLRGGLRNP